MPPQVLSQAGLHYSIREAHSLGLSYTELMQRFEVCRATVARAIREDPDDEARMEPRAENPKVARRRSFVRALATAVIRRRGVAYPKFPTAHMIAGALKKQHGIDVSDQTVRNDLKAMNFKNRVRICVPSRDAGVLQVRARFCRGLLRQPAFLRRLVKKLVFSDEHTESCLDSSDRTMWVPPGGQAIPRERCDRRNVPRVMVWGAVGFNYKSKLVILPSHNAKAKNSNGDEVPWRMNADRYKRLCLQPNVKDWRDRVFQQDGAPCHKARAVTRYLEGKGVQLLANWPAHSPVLNVIEELWGWMKLEVSRQHPQTLEELIAACLKFWTELPQTRINQLVLSFERKLRRHC